MMTSRLQAWFQEYADAHRHPMNRLTHKIAIPVIVFHILAMLDWIHIVDVTVPGVGPYWVSVGHVAYLLAIGWYVSLHVGLAALMAVLYALCFPLAAVVPKPVVVALAVGGWLIQLAGHSVWEKNRPAFLKNLLQALIGPLFFVAAVTGVWRPGRGEAGAR